MNGRWIQLKTSRITGLSAFLKEGRLLPSQAPARQTFAVGEGECQSGEVTPTQAPRPVKVPLDKAAFSLVELMVVLAIIGLLTGLGLPMIKALNQNSALSAGSRQLMDDISLARMKAINNRTTVYMVFSPTNLLEASNELTNYATMYAAKFANDHRPFKQINNLISGQYGAYALIAARTVGDQPGRPTPRYLTEWRTLPEGIFIAPAKFSVMTLDGWSKTPATNRPFAYSTFPFPTTNGPSFALPYIAFSPLGQLAYPIQPKYGQDEIIPLTRGSMMVEKDASGRNIMGKADFREIPPGNATNLYNRVHIFWQTGRAKVEKLEAK